MISGLRWRSGKAIWRATVSLAAHCITQIHTPRHATLQGFYDIMAGRNARKAFARVSASQASSLPP